MSPESSLRLNAEHASVFASLALSHITREFPNKLDHILLTEDDVKGPRALHPIFYGSFDWHSCVHGYWLLARLHRHFPDLPQAAHIRDCFNRSLTAANVAVEAEYAAHPSRGAFERPYGWAWLLQLSAELHVNQSEEGQRWAATLQPLAQVFAKRFMQFLPKATYPIRGGAHFNTAFALSLALNYANEYADNALGTLLRATAKRWYLNDANAQVWEPSGDDYLSPTLMEAECMRSALSVAEFDEWFAKFLPHVLNGSPATLFTPAVVSDRTDGKIGHLDGLNLSRAWCWRSLASHFPVTDSRHAAMRAAADTHLQASLPHVSGDYQGEHWLATYALLALDA